MPEYRYLLACGQLLGRLMRCPDASGQRHTVRSLAAAAGISKSKIHSMLHGQQPEVTEEQADRIAEAVGVHTTPLFTSPVSAFADTDASHRHEGEGQ